MVRSRKGLIRDASFFIAMLATAIALGGALAHAFELPGKIDLTQESYFAVQRIYRGWNQPGLIIAALRRENV